MAKLSLTLYLPFPDSGSWDDLRKITGEGIYLIPVCDFNNVFRRFWMRKLTSHAKEDLEFCIHLHLSPWVGRQSLLFIQERWMVLSHVWENPLCPLLSCHLISELNIYAAEARKNSKEAAPTILQKAFGFPSIEVNQWPVNPTVVDKTLMAASPGLALNVCQNCCSPTCHSSANTLFFHSWINALCFKKNKSVSFLVFRENLERWFQSNFKKTLNRIKFQYFFK